MLEEDGRGPYLVVVVGWPVSLTYDNDVSTRPSALIGTTERRIIVPYRDGPHQGVSVLLRLQAPQTLVIHPREAVTHYGILLLLLYHTVLYGTIYHTNGTSRSSGKTDFKIFK